MILNFGNRKSQTGSHDTRFPNYTKYSAKEISKELIQRDAINPLSPHSSKIKDGDTRRMGSTREFLHVGRGVLVRASRIYFHFSRISPPFYRISEFCSRRTSTFGAMPTRNLGEFRWRMNEILDWFFVIHLRKYSCIHDGCRMNPSNPFDRFLLLGLSIPWMQIRFRRGIIWACSRYFITLFLTFIHIFAYTRACFTLIYFDVRN